METNWNQLIERYLQNELSEEGKMAFEQELQFNPELREELEMHRLVQDAAKRASQRGMIQQVGKAYLRNLRIKQFSLGIAVTAAVVTGIVLVLHQKQPEQSGGSNPLASAQTEHPIESNEAEHEPVSVELADTLSGPSPDVEATPLDSRSGIHSGDSNPLKVAYGRTTSRFSLQKKLESASFRDRPMAQNTFVKTSSVAGMDTGATTKRKVEIPDIQKEFSGGKLVEREEVVVPFSRKTAWVQLYDSVGRFNDLYCGYALVMDEAKFGFVDRKGNVFIPLIYDEIVVTVNIKSSKQKNRRSKHAKKKKVLYIPKRSGSEVRDCEENAHPLLKNEPDSIFLREE